MLTATAAASRALGAPPRNAMGLATTSFMTARRPKDTFEFLEYSHSLGAGGIQAALASTEADYLRKLRDRAGQLGMFIEVMAGLPRQGVEAFERTALAAKEVGGLCLRAACLGGRRYETFATLEDWKRFVADSKASIERALPVIDKHRIPLALENHKDWTLEEFLALLKQYSHERLGVCLDTGNNIALLDDPMELVKGLAPYAFSTHIKDMGLAEYPDGFLLSEVPLGEGILNLKAIVSQIRTARPQTKMSLEMITRDPLQVPCLTGKYWATFPERSGRHLARTLALVRSRKDPRPLPRMDGLDATAQLRVEEDNVKQCLNYAREQLGL
jgi:sugar phosphate isomerase/epimerase